MLIDNNKFPELKRKIKEMSRLEVHVGILGNAELAIAARANEYGAKIPVSEKMRNYLNALGLHLKKTTKFIIIPERSFFRTAFDLRKNINKVVNIAEQVFSQDSNVKNILDKIGLYMTGAIQQKIRSNIPPANHPFTTEQKGGKNKTLINTGALAQGISHKIV
jgi:hypothetical protein